jgi:hypothetical protein
MTYEDAIVEDKCAQAPIEEQCKNALEHYRGISRIAMHSSSLIECCIEEYPTLRKQAAQLRPVVEALSWAITFLLNNASDDVIALPFNTQMLLKYKQTLTAARAVLGEVRDGK